MYDIFIKNFRPNEGGIYTGEQWMYSIPIEDSRSMNALTNPTVSTGLGKTGSFEFSIDAVHPFYNAFLQMRTIMRVVYDGITIFRGRVLTIDVSPMTGAKKIHLEGDMAFLMDSQQPGVKESSRPAISVLSYLQKLINVHNQQMAEAGETDKMFALGEVPGQYSAAIKPEQRVVVSRNEQYGSDSFESTNDALSSLSSEYGGYFRTRYENYTCYLDWLENSFRYDINSQPIEIGENLIDISSSTEVDNIFTAVIPVGSVNGEDLFIDGYKTDVHGDNNRILVPQIVSQFSDEELNKGFHAKSDYENAVNNYGIIYKTQKFDAETKDDLWKKAITWIKDTYVGGVTSFSISALDLCHVNPSFDKFLTGDRVRVIYPDLSYHTNGYTPTIEKTLTIVNASHNLYHPENNQYSIGVSDTIIDRSSSRSKASANKKAANSPSGKASSKVPSKKPPGDEKKQEVSLEALEREAIHFIVGEEHNNPLFLKLKQQGLTSERETAILRSSQIRLTDDLYTFDTIEDKFPVDPKDPNPPTEMDKQVLAYMATSILLKGQGGIIDFGLPYVDSFIDPSTKEKITDYRVGLSMELNGYQNAVQQRRIDMSKVEMKDGHWVLKEGVDPTDIDLGTTTSLDGNKGGVNGLLLTAGLDGTGDMPTFSADGTTGGFNLFNPSTWFKPNGDVVDEDPQPTVDIQGKDGSAGFGERSGDYKIKLNKPVSYVDKNGQLHKNVTGFVSADDFLIKDTYDSLKVRLGVFNDLIADRATIGQLTAVEGKIDRLTAKAITTDTLSSGLTMSGSLVVNNYIQGSSAAFGSLMVGSRSASWTDSFKVVTGVTLTKPSLVTTSEFTVTDDDGKERTGRLVTSWNNGSISVSTGSLYFLGLAM